MVLYAGQVTEMCISSLGLQIQVVDVSKAESGQIAIIEVIRSKVTYIIQSKKKTVPWYNQTLISEGDKQKEDVSIVYILGVLYILE